jgi:hypothetical protein
MNNKAFFSNQAPRHPITPSNIDNFAEKIIHSHPELMKSLPEITNITGAVNH